MSNINGKNSLKIWAPAKYKIEVDGAISKLWADNFCDMRITTRTRKDNSIVTTMVGRVRDQAELSGILNCLYDLHLSIRSVNLIED